MTDPIPRETIDLAAPASPIFTLHVEGDRAYVVTRSVEPTRLGVLDLPSGTIADHAELPAGDGAWALSGLDDDVFVGTYDEGDLLRYDTATGEVSHVGQFLPDTHICDFAVDGGRLYFGTYPTTNVYEYDPATDEVVDLGPACPDESYARKLDADDGELYVGVGSNAHLIRIDRATGERTDVLPEAFADEGWVDGVTVAEDRLLYRASGDLVVADRGDPSAYETAAPEGRDVGQFVFRDDDVYLLASDGETRAAYRYSLVDGTFEELGPVPGGGLDLYLEGTRLVGAESDGTVWTYDYETGEDAVVDVADAGLPAGAEVPFSLAVLEGVPVVAGHGTLHVHDGSEDSPRRVDTLGEAKAMTAVDGALYQAIYPGAKLASYSLGNGTVEHLATIGEEQNRPRAIHYDAESGLVFVATVPDYGLLGGAVSAYDPATGDLRVERNVVSDQSISALASIGDALFLGSEIHGGNGSEPVADEAVLLAWDVDDWAPIRESVPLPGAEAISNLAIHDDTLFAASTDGQLARVDPADGSVLARETVVLDGGFGQVGTKLLELRGSLFGVTESALYRIDPETLAATTVLSDLDARNPSIAAHDGDLYVLGDPELRRFDGDRIA